MPKLYCQSCGGATDWSERKPAFCAFCSEPFVRKIERGSSSTTARKVDRFQEKAQRMEEIQEEIPSSLSVHVEGEKRQKVTVNITQEGKVVGSTIPKDMSFERFENGTGFAEADAGLPKAKEEALKHMLHPTPMR